MIEKFRDFIRYGHVYTKSVYLATFFVSVMFGLGFWKLLPNADVSSTQAGLTIIAEILGVLLGVVLVVIGVIVQQEQQSEERLLNSYPKYYKFIQDHVEQVVAGQRQLSELITSKKISLRDFIFPPLTTTYGDVLANFIGLSIALKILHVTDADKLLLKLGYTKKEIDHVLFGMGTTGAYNAAGFLELTQDAFNVVCVGQTCSPDVWELAGKLLTDFSNEGIDKALKQYDRSKKFLASKFLALSIILLATTTMGAVLVLFGTTDLMVSNSFFIGAVYSVVIGFFLSIIVTLFMLRKIF